MDKNISLIDIDSTIPNLALMKISSYHKNLNDHVLLNKYNNPDKVYISCIFEKNSNQALGLSKMFDCEVVIGGYGINNKQLPDLIEKRKPDYSLYNIDYSIGYTSKGCIRKCKFCIVPKYEGTIKNHHSISLIMNSNHNKLMLLDNNFLASPKWKENLIEIIDKKIKVNFTQGLDIRLINNENAKLLSDAKIFNRKFKSNQIHFAFDSLKNKKMVIKGIKILKDNGIKSYRLMFYVLVNFDSSLLEDFYRFAILRKFNAEPFIMRYSISDKIINHFARYVNRRIYKVTKFENYDRLNISEKFKVKEIMNKLPLDLQF